MVEKITLTIDLEDDFDGISLINAIRSFPTKNGKIILTRLYNIWVKTIGEPDWVEPEEE